MSDAFYRKLKKYGPRTVFAKGDNFVAAVLLYNDDPETRLFYEDGTPVTGFEGARHREGKPIDVSKKFQPIRVYFDPKKKNEYIGVLRPQRFRDHADRGELDIFVGAGYDLEIHQLVLEALKEGREINIPLNGSFTDPDKGTDIMIEALHQCGYALAVPIGIKKVRYPVIAGRSTGIRNLNDLRRDHTFESENVAVMFYLFEKGIESEFLLAPGGSDDAVFLGLRDAAADLVETGKSLIDNVKSVRLVYENGEPADVMRSTSFLTVSKMAYENDPEFFNDCRDWVRERARSLEMYKDPKVKSLLEDHYNELKNEFRAKEIELGLD